MSLLISLPEDLQLDIFSRLSDKERAAVALLDKSWLRAVRRSWSEVSFHKQAKEQDCNYCLNALAQHSKENLRKLNIHLGRADLSHAVISFPSLKAFNNLESLQLGFNPNPSPDYKSMRPGYDPAFAIDSAKLQGLVTLTKLTHLSFFYNHKVPAGRPRSAPHEHTTVVLEEITSFSQLRQLGLCVVTTCVKPASYTLSSCMLELSLLTSLVLVEQSTKCAVFQNSTFESLTARLRCLKLELARPLRQVLKLPQTTFLQYNFWNNPDHKLRLDQSLACLNSLSVIDNAVDYTTLGPATNLSSLSLRAHEYSTSFNWKDVSPLSRFSELKMLTIKTFVCHSNEILKEFLAIPRLESLSLCLKCYLDFLWYAGPESRELNLLAPGTERGLMHLKELSIQADINTIIDVSLNGLPALEELSMDSCLCSGHIQSDTLKLLYMYLDHKHSRTPMSGIYKVYTPIAISFGELSRITVLNISHHFTLQDIAKLQLGNLSPSLRCIRLYRPYCAATDGKPTDLEEGVSQAILTALQTQKQLEYVEIWDESQDLYIPGNLELMCQINVCCRYLSIDQAWLQTIQKRGKRCGLQFGFDLMLCQVHKDRTLKLLRRQDFDVKLQSSMGCLHRYRASYQWAPTFPTTNCNEFKTYSRNRY